MDRTVNILDGVKIVDLTSNLAGPTATMILASLGASIFKVERPGGEDARGFTPSVEGQGIMFDWANRGKRSIICNLASAEGKEILGKLVAHCDVLIHSFRPGVMEKLGFDATNARKINPKLIYADLTAFGVGTPGAPLAGYDAMVQAYTGIMLANGSEGDEPVRTAPSTIDVGTGQWMAMGILIALMARNMGREISHLEATLFDTAMAFMPDKAAASLLTGKAPGRQGSGNVMSVPYAAFRCADGYVFIAAPNERLWRKLASALGRPELIENPRFKTLVDRVAHLKEMAVEINSVLATDTVEHWLDVLDLAGVPAGPVNDLAQAARSTVARGRKTFSDEPIPAVRLPLALNGNPLGPVGKTPSPGEHTQEILTEIGFDKNQIQALLDNRVVGASA